MKEVFPKEILEFTAEVHYFRFSGRSICIYLCLVSAVLALLLALPFIKVDVYSTSRGTIKPGTERLSLSVITSGKVLFSALRENNYVHRGDTLVLIDNNGIDAQLELLRHQRLELQDDIEDLKLLLGNKPLQTDSLNTPKYQRSHVEYLEELKGFRILKIQKYRAFERKSRLFDRKVISRSEYELATLEFNLSQKEMQQYQKQQQSLWQSQLTDSKVRYRELLSEETQLQIRREQFIVTAPLNGNVLNVRAQPEGSWLAAGTQLAEITPDTDLFVECYVSPKHIGLLREDLGIQFQIDAYDHHQWGLATGRIVEIGKDIESIENQPAFTVRCVMDQQQLKLKNGIQGKLKKGMTVRAHFLLTKRSLWELLYDKTEDWLHPGRDPLVRY